MCKPCIWLAVHEAFVKTQCASLDVDNYHSIAAIRAQMRDKWQGNRRASVAKDDMSASRWKQLRHTLESKKVVNSISVFSCFNDFEGVSEAYDLLYFIYVQ